MTAKDYQHQMIDAWQIHSMRQQQVDSFPDQADVYRLTRTSDGKGGYSAAVRVLIAEGVPASWTPAQQLQSGGQADRNLEIAKWTVRLPWDTDVQDNDLLHWYNEDVWVQVEDAKWSKTRGTAVTCMAETVKGSTPGVD